MKKILIAIFAGLLTATSLAGADRVVVHIDKIEGTVVELPKTPAKAFDSVRLSMTFTSSPEASKDLYSTITKGTEYSVQNLKRPRRDEVILVLPKNSLPAGVKIGDKIRVLGFAMGDAGNGFQAKQPPTPLRVKKIELNPRG